MIKTIADALAERGYETLTDVQNAVLKPELQDADLLVSAQTGSGKTVGFGLAIAKTLLEDADHFGPAALPLALVVAPTRELAMQVKRELGWLYEKAGVRMASCVGGMDARDERRALERGAHIVVGTPGRLCDHIKRGALALDELRVVVLDEADEMLDMGFREDLEFMLTEAPETRRTLMFSATVPPMIAKIAQEFQRDAVRVSTVSKGDQHADITYQAMTVHNSEVENAIINLLRFHDAENAIVFANTRAGVSRLMARFSNRGFNVVSLSGELSQTERTHALQAMRDGRANVCVATDVAARGIDLPNLDLVIHADLPQGSEALLHRSGRTGRAGRKGVSVLIATPKSYKKCERLLQWAKLKAEWVRPPSAEQILQKDQERLLADPVWQEEPTDSETAFAQTLLEQHSAEKIAAAYLRLYRSRQSAPEELSNPDEKPARKNHEEFGPSTWFSISVGRKNQAEPRWLLPMILRNSDLDKHAIGAIRVQFAETFIEVANASLGGLQGVLANGGELEEGVRLKQLDGIPDMNQPGPDFKRGDKPRERRDDNRPKGPRPDREDRPKREERSSDKPRWEKPKGEKPKGDKPFGDKPRSDKPRSDKPRGDKPAASKRVWDDKKPRQDDRKPRPSNDPAKEHRGRVKPDPVARQDDDKPKSPRKKGGDDPSKSFRKKDGAAGKPRKPGGKPGGKPSGKPAGDGKRGPAKFQKTGKKTFGGEAKPRRKG